MSWLSASHNSYIRSLVSHPVYFSMSPNRAIPAEKSIRSSPLAAARPLTILSWPEALNATGSRLPAGCPSAAMAVHPLLPKKIQCMVGLIESSVYDETSVDF